MNHVAISRPRNIRIISLFLILSFLFFFPRHAAAQQNQSEHPGFWVSGSAEVTVKADEAIVYLTVRATAPNATDALSENERKTQDVAQALDGLGLKGKYRFSGNRIGAVRASFQQIGGIAGAINGQQQSQLSESSKFVFITFDASDLAAADFDKKLASTVDALTKAGAGQGEFSVLPQLAAGQGASGIVYTVKNPAPALMDATRQAMDRAKATGEEVAKKMNIKITGVLDARVNRALETPLPRPQALSVLDELHLHYYSFLNEDVTIPATFAVEFSIQ